MTHEITLQTTVRPNPSLLTEELRAALGADLRAVSTEPERVRVVLAAPPTTAQAQAIRDVLAAHHPTGESAATRAERSRRVKLAALRATDAPLTPDDFAGESALIRQLARKVLLLEARLAALSRGMRET
jgi:hypothetical protein